MNPSFLVTRLVTVWHLEKPDLAHTKNISCLSVAFGGDSVVDVILTNGFFEVVLALPIFIIGFLFFIVGIGNCF